MSSALSRRKFIAISAAAGGAGLVPFGAPAWAADADAHLVEWTGLSLGSVATIRLHHPDKAAGERLVRRAVDEARRLEAIFSLYREDTALAELNRSGLLVAPPAELVDLLRLCDRVWADTQGVFDPTVQPLWQCYAVHFSTPGASASGPEPRQLAEALQRVGWPKVQVSRDRIALSGRGMGLTLNGIAQGYITDRIIDLLREAGISSSLVDMGEIRTLGRHPDGRPWRAALQGPSPEPSPSRTIDVVDKAVATSASEGFRFTEDGRCNHLFNPATGTCADATRSIAVVSASAAEADALSTACALMDREATAALLARLPGTRVYSTG